VFSVQANRSLRLGKTRNGAGGGMSVAFTFDAGSLRFSEQGVITKEAAHEPVEDPFANSTTGDQ